MVEVIRRCRRRRGRRVFRRSDREEVLKVLLGVIRCEGHVLRMFSKDTGGHLGGDSVSETTNKDAPRAVARRTCWT